MTVHTSTDFDTINEMDPVFAQMAAASAGHCWAVPELTDREKVFLALAADVCQPALGFPFEMHVRAGLQRGVSTADMRALLRLISYDSGYVAALAALERLAGIEAAAAGLPHQRPHPQQVHHAGEPV
ncbi:carboxymuconolactone decarboxylase family protein, partial [Microbispora rosea]